MAMQLAVLLAALYGSRLGAFAFRINPLRIASPPAVPLPTIKYRTCSLAAPRQTIAATPIGRNRTAAGASAPLYPAKARSSSGEENEAPSSGAEQATGGISSSSDGSGKPTDLVGRLGSAGLVSYGILNGLWYSVGIAYVMLGPTRVVPAAGGIEGNISASVKHFGKVIGLVWLGSQATKPVRLALATLLAPAADKLIGSTQRKLGLKKKDTVSLLCAVILGSTLAFCLTAIAFGAARAAVASTVASTGPASSSAAVLLPLVLGKVGGSH